MVTTSMTSTQKYTPAEYLQREEQAAIKSELIQGDIIEMAGASANHNRIAVNMCRLLPLDNGNQPYEIFMGDMRLWLPAYSSYTYPDVLAVAATPQFTDEKQTALINPCLIVEIRSASTAAYDKTDKFQLYRSIPEFEEYVLVDQTAYRVEQYTKKAVNQWLLTEWIGPDAVFSLQSVGVEITLVDLYKRVQFEAAAAEQKDGV
ncbi:MAG: Uma2 family endonuclease [Leptolyngbyaceae bacterium]|nr:Uma2 family endonuclease [Leptolyngbyaceae bacterium]